MSDERLVKLIDDLGDDVKAFGGEVHSLAKAITHMAASFENIGEKANSNQDEIKDLRKRIEASERWQASAMVKIGALVAVVVLAASTIFNQWSKPPTPVYIHAPPPVQIPAPTQPPKQARP